MPLKDKSIKYDKNSHPHLKNESLRSWYFLKYGMACLNGRQINPPFHSKIWLHSTLIRHSNTPLHRMQSAQIDPVSPTVRIWATTWQNQQNECAPSEDSGQPGHPPSLTGVFAVRMKIAWILSYPLSAQRRLWTDWADAQTLSESSLGAHSSCWFCHVVAHLPSEGNPRLQLSLQLKLTTANKAMQTQNE